MTLRLLPIALLPMALLGLAAGPLAAAEPLAPLTANPDLELARAAVHHDADLDLLVFEQTVRGRAGATVPRLRGQVDGAPVLAYVFPTDLPAAAVGFGELEGTLALAATSHPDFDDTPLWDEDGDRDFGNDGVVFHTHWVVLIADERVPGGLAARPVTDGETLPTTAPGMPIALDSPGHPVVLRGDTLRIPIPVSRVGGRTDFRFGALTAYLEVSQQPDRPMLGVHRVYSVLSGDGDLPFRVGAR